MASLDSLGISFSETLTGERSTQKLIQRIKLMQGRLRDMQPAEQEMVAAFKEMEADIFKNGGRSAKWGFNGGWAPLSEKTLANKRSLGQPEDPLVATGALKQAASVNPAVRFFHSSLEIKVDTRQNNPEVPKNYGVFHQNGGENEHPPQRMFIPEPLSRAPVFVAVINQITKNYIYGKEVKLRQQGGVKAENITKNLKRRKAYKETVGSRSGNPVGKREPI